MSRMIAVICAFWALPLAAGADGSPSAEMPQAGAASSVRAASDACLRKPCRPLRLDAAEALGQSASPMYSAPAARTAFRMLASKHITSTQFDGYKAAFLKRGEVHTNVIDVMIAFDRGAERWVKENWNGDVEGYAAQCLAKMNQVLANSGLDDCFTLNLVATPVVDIDVFKEYATADPYDPGETYTDYSTVLRDAAGTTAAGKKSVPWKALRAERELSSADVVSILVDSETSGTVGLAYALDDVGIKYPDFMSDVAYSIVCIEMTQRDSTQMHEIGHLLGAGHSDQMDTSIWPEDLLGPQLFAYSSSAYFNAAFPDDRTSDWRYTVMGYNYPGWYEVCTNDWGTVYTNEVFAEEEMCFSSPSLFAENGAAKGDEMRDNARTLRETYALAANYRVRKVALRVVAPEGGGTVSGAGAYESGKSVKLVAKPSTGFVFAGWYGAYDADAGAFSRPLDGAADYRTTTYPYAVGMENATVYARFVKGVDDAESISLEEAGRTFATDSGAASFRLNVESKSLPKVSVKGLPPGMKFDAKTLTVYGSPAKPGTFTVTVSLANASIKKAVAATFAIEVVFPVVTVAAAGSGTGKITGAGAYAEGKKVTLKATADKDSVFMGWYRATDATAEGEKVGELPNLSFVMEKEDRAYVARFITSKEDADSIAATVGRFALDAASDTASASIPCGVYLRWPVAASALSTTTIKVAGLPAGLKFTAKDIMKKGSKTDVEIPRNTIYGAPTAASKVDKKSGRVTPSSAKITVTTAGKSSRTFVVAVTVDAMAPWAAGTFNGGGMESQATLTVGANGKIKGSLVENGVKWALSADSFDAYDGERYTASLVGKSGKLQFSGTLSVVSEPLGDGARGIAFSRSAAGDASGWTAWQNLWKSEPWKTIARPFAKAPVLVADAGLSLKFAATGAVAAKYNSYSCSSVLIPVSQDGQNAQEFFACLHFPPKQGKFAGYTTQVKVAWNGTSFELR